MRADIRAVPFHLAVIDEAHKLRNAYRPSNTIGQNIKWAVEDHLKQIALGCVAYEQAHRHFPSGGWGWRWAGDPDRGFGRNQPGGWICNVLPFLEQSRLRNKGKGE